MHPNAELIDRFYRAFQDRDHAAMARCYHPQARFSDPAFPNLQGRQVPAMWHMLCERGEDLVLTYRDVQADDKRGRAHWEPVYSFSKTGRRVHNVIDAEFELVDGRIHRHRDRFDLWRWSRQALGPAGLLLGWSPFIRNKIQRTAAKSLASFIAKHPEYQES